MDSNSLCIESLLIKSLADPSTRKDNFHVYDQPDPSRVAWTSTSRSLPFLYSNQILPCALVRWQSLSHIKSWNQPGALPLVCMQMSPVTTLYLPIYACVFSSHWSSDFFCFFLYLCWAHKDTMQLQIHQRIPFSQLVNTSCTRVLINFLLQLLSPLSRLPAPSAAAINY